MVRALPSLVSILLAAMSLFLGTTFLVAQGAQGAQGAESQDGALALSHSASGSPAISSLPST